VVNNDLAYHYNEPEIYWLFLNFFLFSIKKIYVTTRTI
jgi:hypothetical protein